MNPLIESSDLTRQWLKIIEERVREIRPELSYSEAQNYAKFKNPNTNRNIAYLNPTSNQIRLFLRLGLDAGNDLEITPSTFRWADMYPSLFKIDRENKIERAIDLIIRSYEQDSLE